MTRYGWAIKTGGDPELAGALADGIEAGTQTNGAAAAARMAYRSDAVRRVAMMRHTPEEWAEMADEVPLLYGDNRPLPWVLRGLLVGYAMICYGVAAVFRRVCSVTEWRDE